MQINIMLEKPVRTGAGFLTFVKQNKWKIFFDQDIFDSLFPKDFLVTIKNKSNDRGDSLLV